MLKYVFIVILHLLITVGVVFLGNSLELILNDPFIYPIEIRYLRRVVFAFIEDCFFVDLIRVGVFLPRALDHLAPQVSHAVFPFVPQGLIIFGTLLAKRALKRD